jgi:hypothetical protein
LHNRTDPLYEPLPTQQRFRTSILERLRVPAGSAGITRREYRDTRF